MVKGNKAIITEILEYGEMLFVSMIDENGEQGIIYSYKNKCYSFLFQFSESEKFSPVYDFGHVVYF